MFKTNPETQFQCNKTVLWKSPSNPSTAAAANVTYTTDDGCSAVELSTLEIPVLPALSNVTIAWDEALSTLCYNTAPSTASAVNPNEFTTMDWQWNANNGQGSEPIFGATTTTLTPSALVKLPPSH